MYVESYFQTAAYLYEQYDLQKPLPIFLKEYFKQNKNSVREIGNLLPNCFMAFTA